MELGPGAIVAGRFEVVDTAGAGGMGIVYRARDLVEGGTVALKLIAGSGDDRARRFSREVKALAEVDHPAVVRYLAHGHTPAGELYLAMEWLDGEDLSARLARGAFALDEAIVLLRRIGAATSAAHARGIVHRDIKPQNIFLVDRQLDRAKLLDFGLARLRDGTATMTARGTVMGTPGYMAPEQARGDDDIGAPADVFALGCVLFECVAGRPAFVAHRGWAKLAKVLFEEAPRVRSLRRDVPAALDELVGRMLAKDPAARPRDAGEVVRALADLRVRATTAPLPSSDSHLAITEDELRLVSVVVADVGAEEAEGSDLDAEPTFATSPTTILGRPSHSTIDELRGIAGPHGAHVERLASGLTVATFLGSGAATDLAAQAARFALALHARVPTAPMVLTTGQAAVSGRWPVGEAIDRAAALLVGGGPRHGDAAIVIDPITAGLLDVRFEVRDRPAGIELVGERAPLDAGRTLLGRPSPFVGRDRELVTLEAFVTECVSESVARAVLVTGEPGIGKSRLRDELAGRIQGRYPGLAVWLGRGDPMSAGSSFGLVGQALRRAAGVRDGEPLDQRRAHLSTFVARYLPEPDRRRVSEFLGELIGAPYPDAGREQLAAARQDPFRMGDQLRRAWEDLIAAATAAHPVAIVLEDLHWGDLPSIKLLDAALGHSRERPLLVMALARPEVHELFPRLWSERDAHEVRLGGLGRRSAERLVREVLGDRVSGETIARLAEQCAGNAFYLEELIRAAAEGKGDRPGTVLAMVQARLDGIEPEARRILRAASVFGQALWRGGVAAVLGPAADPDLDAWLTALRDRELLVERAPARLAGEREYVFRHALVRDAAYATFTDADRALAHRLAGRWLEAAGEADALALAEHFEKGDELDRAAASFERAAMQALEGNDFAGAIARAERGVAAGAAGPVLGRLRFVESQAQIWRGELAAAETATREAIDLLPRGDAIRYRALGRLAWSLGQRGERSAISGVVDELREPAPASAAEVARVIALAQVTVELVLAAEPVDGLVELALTQASALAATEASVRPWRDLIRATCSVLDNDRAAALTLYLAASDAFDAIGDRRLACLNRMNAGFLATELGAYEQAESTLRSALEASLRMGLDHSTAIARTNLGLAMARAGRFAEAGPLVEQAAVAFHSQGNARHEANARIYLATILHADGDLAAAEAEARIAAELLEGAPLQQPQAQATLARILLAQGRHDEAHAAARSAMEALAAAGSLEEGESLVRLAYAEAQHAQGDHAGAARTALEARERLLSEAARITDEGLRASFLERVAEHAQILVLATRWTAPST